MKLKDFIKLQDDTDILVSTELINIGGGRDCKANELWQYIYSKIMEWIASGESNNNTIKMVEKMIGDYEIKDKELEAKTVKLMEDIGFTFEETE